jgi:hypothetical protein
MAAELTAEQRRQIADYLSNVHEMLTGTGRHADHEQEQVGRCRYCSCGMRVQTGTADP